MPPLPTKRKPLVAGVLGAGVKIAQLAPLPAAPVPAGVAHSVLSFRFLLPLTTTPRHDLFAPARDGPPSQQPSLLPYAGTVLRLETSPSLRGRTAALATNFPLSGHPFDRKARRDVAFVTSGCVGPFPLSLSGPMALHGGGDVSHPTQPTSSFHRPRLFSDVPNTDRHVEVVLDRPGNFDLWLTVSPDFEAWRAHEFDEEACGTLENATIKVGGGPRSPHFHPHCRCLASRRPLTFPPIPFSQPRQTTILVEPILCLGDKPLHLSGLCLQSHIPACIGPLDRWWSVLQVASETGYNMIHLCPPQVCTAEGEEWRAPAVCVSVCAGVLCFSSSTKAASSFSSTATWRIQLVLLDSRSAVPEYRPVWQRPGQRRCVSCPRRATVPLGVGYSNRPGPPFTRHAAKKFTALIKEANMPREQGGLGLLFLIDVVWNHTSFDR